MTSSLVRSSRLLRLEEFAQRCDLHPDLVRRFVHLGLIDAALRLDGELWFAPAQISQLARMLRLREDLALNYSALALVMDLLDRIDRLERNRPERV